jgi:aryl-alcohol dehydrogenase-like predicted oxidoreductase
MISPEEGERLRAQTNAGRVSRLVMGTAQLGASYGIANTTRLDPAEKQALLRLAVALGVRTFDTARAYGTSEEVLGTFLRECDVEREGDGFTIVTKLDPLAQLAADAAPTDAVEAARLSVGDSRRALGLEHLPTVLLHRAAHIRSHDGAIWDALRQLKADGVIGKLGVSVQSPAELAEAIAEPAVEQVQIPFNLLDWRWNALLDDLAEERRRRKLTVHVRSIYLQGLLVTDEPRNWARAHVDDAREIRGWLEGTATALGRNGVGDLCLAFVAAQDWVDGIVVGIDNEAQLVENVAMITRPPLDRGAVAGIVSGRPRLEAATLDPARWRRAA